MQKHFVRLQTNESTKNVNFDEILRYSDECDCDAYLKDKSQTQIPLLGRFFNNIRSIFRMAVNYKKTAREPLIKLD